MRVSDLIKSIRFLTGIVLITCTINVQAVPTSFRFTGEVTSYDFTGVDPFGGDIDIGSLLNGVFTYNLDALDVDSDPNFGVYIMEESYDYGAEYSIGDRVFDCCYDSTEVEVTNDMSGTDSLLFGAGAGVLGVFHEYFNIFLTGPDTVFDSDSLPTVPPNIDDFYDASFIYTLLTPTDTIFRISGDIFSTSKVPEPATVALMGLGLIGLGLARRRQQ
jgi:hypothetical protein